MKTLFFILALSVSAIAQEQDTFYCIQIMSTKNPDFIRAEHLAVMPLDTAMVEATKDCYRIMYVYSDLFEAEVSLMSIKRAFKDAFICRRTKEQVLDLYHFYSEL
jgi:hypothetical protein